MCLGNSYGDATYEVSFLIYFLHDLTGLVLTILYINVISFCLSGFLSAFIGRIDDH